MSIRSTFHRQIYYEVPLLRLLCKLPNRQGEVTDVLYKFEEKYKQHIPQEHWEKQIRDEPAWRHHVRTCREFLKHRGFLTMPARGTWQATEIGCRWLEENPEADRLPPRSSKPSNRTLRTPSTKRSSIQKPSSIPPGVTLEMLKQTRISMPDDQFRQIWGEIYDQLLADEQTKVMTQVNQIELGHRAKRKVDEIHAFLSGQNSEAPRSDVVCDWIHFCYEMELYREAVSLLQYAHKDELDAAYYRRAKKWAEASRTKLGW